MMDYCLHFLGGLALFVIFCYFFDKRVTAFWLTMFGAVIWELAQLDVWLNPEYKLIDFLNYDWINNGLDIIAAILGVASAVMIMDFIKAIKWNRIRSKKY